MIEKLYDTRPLPVDSNGTFWYLKWTRRFNPSKKQGPGLDWSNLRETPGLSLSHSWTRWVKTVLVHSIVVPPIHILLYYYMFGICPLRPSCTDNSFPWYGIIVLLMSPRDPLSKNKVWATTISRDFKLTGWIPSGSPMSGDSFCLTLTNA